MNESTAAMTARETCRQLFDRFHACVDDGHANAAAEVFTTDAVVEVPSGAARGSREISDALAARDESPRATVHVVGSFDLRLASADEAMAAGSLVVYAGDRGQIDRTPEALARYAVAFRRANDGWKIARLEVRLVGQHAGTGE
jgi:ketosteroid isomerase-like protein